MPSRSKKKRTMKRKKERTNHQTPTNSSCPQGNGTSGDHDDSSDHPLTDEDFSPRSSMEAKPEHEHEHEHEPEPEPEVDPESAVSEDASAVPIEQPTVSESEQTEVTTAVPLEVLQESSAPREVREKSGEGSLYSERTEIPVAIPQESSAPPEVREKSGEGSLYSERTEIPVAIPRDTPATGPASLLERRASWWNCCGLLDVFRGSQS